MEERNPWNLITAYIIIALFVIAFFILLAIITHLIYITIRKTKDNTAGKGLRFFLISTICAIISFEATCVLIICVILQVILIEESPTQDDHQMNSYYELFTTMHYFVAIMDTFGHLCVVLVFIARYQYTFRTGYFTASQSVIRILYIVLILLFACSVGIIALIVVHRDPYAIIVVNIVWEIAVEIMCLSVLYLFLSKLYYLLRMTLHSQSDKTLHGRDKQNQFLDDLTRTVKASIESSQEKSLSNERKNKSPSKAGTKDSIMTIPNIPQITPTTSVRFSPQSSLRMTIDGAYTEPVIAMKLQPINSSNSPNFRYKDHGSLTALNENRIDTKDVLSLQLKLDSMRAPSDPLMSDYEEEKDNDNESELGHMCSFSKAIPTLEDVAHRSSLPSSPVHAQKGNYGTRISILQRKPTLDSTPESPEIEMTMPNTVPCSTKLRRAKSFDRTGASELVQVMNKMTLLVLLAVLMSVLSVIGNVFIEIHLLEAIETQDYDRNFQALWAEILPLMDIIITSFMLYLHFHFAESVYRRLLGKLDVFFLKISLSLLKCFIDEPEDTASCVANQEKSPETPI